LLRKFSLHLWCPRPPRKPDTMKPVAASATIAVSSARFFRITTKTHVPPLAPFINLQPNETGSKVKCPCEGNLWQVSSFLFRYSIVSPSVIVENLHCKIHAMFPSKPLYNKRLSS
jgi:hypothetical protein